jgi:putative proteasome-type protease
MTYCLAIRLEAGLVFLGDSRTNAGVDNVSTYRKVHLFQPDPDRFFVLESAGNLATTQEVLDRINQDLTDPGARESLATVNHLFEGALYIGRLSREVAASHREALAQVGADGTATFLFGGEIRGGGPPDILLVYPEGNYIRASDDRPFLQIGESKYGKFTLELGVAAHVNLATAAKLALTSMVSTAGANLSVGPPYDLVIYRDGTFEPFQARINADSPFLTRLEAVWAKFLFEAIAALPAIEEGDLET